MIIKTLIENTSTSDKFGYEHGLSLYIETEHEKILFDTGASSLFQQNALKMDVKINNVDILVISHGHNDHGGGLNTFLQVNKTAKIYIHQKAFEKHYALSEEGQSIHIGLDENLNHNSQLVLTADRFFIRKNIQLFSKVKHREPLPITNSGLKAEQNGELVNDNFAHEQNLVIEEAGKTLLVTGCAHNGIVNILKHFHDLMGRDPDTVIGGFHLSSRTTGNERSESIHQIGHYLKKTQAVFYTGHCTGAEPYNQLRSLMGEQLNQLTTGSEISL